MKKSLLITFLSISILVTICNNISIANSLSGTIVINKTHKLKITISGLKNNKGQVLVQLKDTLENTVASIRGNIDDNKSEIIFDSVVSGKYSIAYFHDENMNYKLDKNIIGIPKEGYGFSNNASGKYGPPPITERVFIVTEDKSMDLVPYYW